jgi:pimeloyl-ACP methyl ester carboxylesterase
MTTQLAITLAHDYQPGRGPIIVFCGGFNSNRHGNKAMALQAWAEKQNLGYVRFDYQGHGDSLGEFADCTITTWLHDTIAVIDALPETQPVILVGSSMGGWLALLAAQRRPARIAGLVLIACAADMTSHYPSRLTELAAQQDASGRRFYAVPNDYDDQAPYAVYQAMLDDGEQYQLLNAPIPITAPVRLIHGLDDDVIPWQRSQAVLSRLTCDQGSLVLLKNGDHRLSKPHELRCIEDQLQGLIAICETYPQH